MPTILAVFSLVSRKKSLLKEFVQSMMVDSFDVLWPWNLEMGDLMEFRELFYMVKSFLNKDYL